MVNRKMWIKRSFMSLSIALGLALVSGCGSVNHRLSLLDNYTPQPRTKVEVGKVTNQTGKTFNIIDMEQALADAFVQVLRKQNLLATGEEGNRLVLSSRIVEYEKGSALQRWMLPGWGSTVLTIEGELTHGERVVGTFQARRTVSIGGTLTIGAWRTIFASVAKDVVKDLRSKIPK
jgi:uncharacterized protein YceK